MTRSKTKCVGFPAMGCPKTAMTGWELSSMMSFFKRDPRAVRPVFDRPGRAGTGRLDRGRQKGAGKKGAGMILNAEDNRLQMTAKFSVADVPPSNREKPNAAPQKP